MKLSAAYFTEHGRCIRRRLRKDDKVSGLERDSDDSSGSPRGDRSGTARADG